MNEIQNMIEGPPLLSMKSDHDSLIMSLIVAFTVTCCLMCNDQIVVMLRNLVLFDLF